MFTVKTLADVARGLAAARSDHGVMLIRRDGTTIMPPEELLRRSLAVAVRLRELGVRRGDRVAVTLPLSPDLLATLFGTALAGGAIVSLNPGTLVPNFGAHCDFIRRVLARTQARVCVGQAPLLATLQGGDPLPSCVFWDPEVSPATDSVDAPEDSLTPDDLAVVQFTSGTSGVPKGAMMSHGNVIANLVAFTQRMQVRPDDVGVCWLPLFHDMGLHSFIASQAVRIRIVLISTELFLFRPETWLQAMSYCGGSITMGPNFAYSRCCSIPDARLTGLALSSWRLALAGAERVSATTLRRFSEKFAPYGFQSRAFLPVYGLAEATLCATMPEAGSGWSVDRHTQAWPGDASIFNAGTEVSYVGVGRALAGHEVAIADGSGVFMPDRTVGEILVRGPSVCRGYFGDDAASQRLLRGGWLHTGDLGYLVDGELYVAGRVDEKIVIHGKNYYADDIEETVESLPELRVGGSLAFSVEAEATDELVVACEVREPGMLEPLAAPAIERQVRDSIAARFQLVPHEVVLLEPRGIPKTPTGKKQRVAFRATYLAGALAARERHRVDERAETTPLADPPR